MPVSLAITARLFGRLFLPELLEWCDCLGVAGQGGSQLLQAACKQPASPQPTVFALLLDQNAYRHEIGVALFGPCIALCKGAESGVSLMCKVDQVILNRVKPGWQRLVFDSILERNIGRCRAFPSDGIAVADQRVALRDDTYSTQQRMTYPTFLSNLIKNSASTLSASSSCESIVALDWVEADMVADAIEGWLLRGRRRR